MFTFLKDLFKVKVPETGAAPTASWYAGWKSWIVLALTFATLISWGANAIQAVRNGQPVPVIPAVPDLSFKPAPVDPTPPQLQLTAGWVNDPNEVEFVKASNGIPNFADTPAGKASLAGEGDVYLWDAAKAVTGAPLPDRDQKQVGSCVSFGTACAIEHLFCVQIVAANLAGQPPPMFKPLCQEVIYGGSRVEIGGGRISGDGSVGAWAAQFVQQYGVVPREKIEGYDLTTYNETTCRAFGRSGVPKKLEAVAKLSPVRGAANVRTAAEAEKAIRQGYPIAVCSDQGFTSTRDKDGFARASGSWGHCMAIIGVRKGARPGFFIENSWGSNWISGPRFPADAPKGGFWADWSTVERMLGQGDSWAFSDAVGFPSREIDIDWFGAVPNPAKQLAQIPARKLNRNRLADSDSLALLAP